MGFPIALLGVGRESNYFKAPQGIKGKKDPSEAQGTLRLESDKIIDQVEVLQVCSIDLDRDGDEDLLFLSAKGTCRRSRTMVATETIGSRSSFELTKMANNVRVNVATCMVSVVLSN